VQKVKESEPECMEEGGCELTVVSRLVLVSERRGERLVMEMEIAGIGRRLG